MRKNREGHLDAAWRKACAAGITRRKFLRLFAAGGSAAVLAGCEGHRSSLGILKENQNPPANPPGAPKAASYSELPRWRGFNLLEKFNAKNPSSNKRYEEWDLDFIAEWGFDFVRLPLDYRIWTKSAGRYEEQPLREIDEVISWARQREIQVSLCLHRAPGYCVGSPKAHLDLWGEGPGGEEARRQFADQWRMFAERYRGIPSSELSFNLINEPPNVTGSQYVRAVTAAIEAIRKEEPDRLIIADGTSWGRLPVPELAAFKVAQSTRGYDPMPLSHYGASWITGAEHWPVPSWPTMAAFNRYLYGDKKSEFQSPLILKGSLGAASLSVNVHRVSSRANLIVRVDGVAVFQKLFEPGPGQGEWKESFFRAAQNVYEAVYDNEYTVLLPERTGEVRIEVTEGDWLTVSELRIKPSPDTPAKEIILKPGYSEWGAPQGEVYVDPQGNHAAVGKRVIYSKETLWTNYVKPWKNFSRTAGIGVHVGEWGCHSRTPHAVALAWMKDCLENWRQAGMGWALWRLRGSFGLLDSGRKDVNYENYKGHQLDRKMLELLTQN
jgi:aryl-phospho-beta-D-glucosidase BglC (GH1 family)